MRRDELSVVLVYPVVLGTYGDRGNAMALAHRARARGLRCRVRSIGLHDPLPRDGDIYVLGGGEDSSMLLALRRLVDDDGLVAAARKGAVVFGVCAGFQMLSRSFVGPEGTRHDGLGLLDVTCGRIDGPRAVGEVLAECTGIEGGEFLTGFENHQGDARLGPDARPLGRVVRGTGNDDGTEGAVQGRVIGTYLHGPALVRNDALADHLLEQVVGELAPFEDGPVRKLRAERRAAALWHRARHRPAHHRLERG
jgi:lipid II isoglutaminyl synthase (glutamine-hydrolysing)